MKTENSSPNPVVAQWKINTTRITFLLMAFVMGGSVWYRLIFESTDLPVPQSLARSLLAALALLSVLGIRHPMRMLPLMLFEIAWKTTWILLIACRAWLNGRVTPEMERLFFECIGIIVAYISMPWGYVWSNYIKQPMEPWRKAN